MGQIKTQGQAESQKGGQTDRQRRGTPTCDQIVTVVLSVFYRSQNACRTQPLFVPLSLSPSSSVLCRWPRLNMVINDGAGTCADLPIGSAAEDGRERVQLVLDADGHARQTGRQRGRDCDLWKRAMCTESRGRFQPTTAKISLWHADEQQQQQRRRRRRQRQRHQQPVNRSSKSHMDTRSVGSWPVIDNGQNQARNRRTTDGPHRRSGRSPRDDMASTQQGFFVGKPPRRDVTRREDVDADLPWTRLDVKYLNGAK